jgi:hypothetical protein
MASTKAISGNAQKNNGGTIVQAGNVDASSKAVSLQLTSINASANKAYGSLVVADTATGNGTSDPHGVKTAKSGTGGLAYFPNRAAGDTNFIIRGAGDNASKINNDSSTLLSVPGGATNVSMNKRVTTRQLGTYSTASYNILAVPNGNLVPGRTKGSGAGTAVNFVQVDGSTAATDAAATVSRAVPGNLTYMFGAVKAVSTSYKAKNVYES